MKNIVIFVPHMPFIFNWILANNVKLLTFLEDISNLHYNIILKFHPRHSKIDIYKNLLHLDNFQVEEGENAHELIESAYLTIAFENSSILFDVIFKEKPLIYINDYITLFDNESVYHEFLGNITQMSFNDLYFHLKNGFCDKDIETFYPKISKKQVFFYLAEDALIMTEKNINKIVR